MNTASLYQKATNPVEEQAPVQETPEQALNKQLFANWRSDAITRIKIIELETQISELLRDAVQLAVTYPTTNNHQQMVQKLIRVDALRKVVESYGR